MAQPPNSTPLRDHAVVIGIDEYREPLETLHGAANDATDFIEWVQATVSDGDVDETRTIKRLSKAGLTDLLNDLSTLVQQVAERGRRLYIFVAGHGSGRRHKSAFLFASEHSLTADACWDLGDVASQLEGIFEEVVLFVDCCRTYIADAHPFPINLRLPYSTSSRIHFHCFACRLHEVAHEQESDGRQRGVFSQKLLRALKGEIPEAVDYQGQVTAYSLMNYLARESNPKPDYHPGDADYLRNIVLARNLPTNSRRLEIRFTRPPESFAIYRGDTLEEVSWPLTKVDETTYVLEREAACLAVVAVPKVARINDAPIKHFVRPDESSTRVEIGSPR